MTAQALVLSALVGGILLTVLALGFSATLSDALGLFRQPAKLVRSMLAMNVAAPLLAAALAAAFDLHPAVKIALVSLAVSPVPPFLPKKELTAGGDASYVVGLLVASALLAVVFVPLALGVLQAVLHVRLAISPGRIIETVAMTILAPLVVGLAVRRLAPQLATRIAKPVGVIALVLLLAGCLAILVKLAPGMWELVGNGTLLAMAAFSAGALAIGHLFGGPAAEDRAVLALSTASRHPGVAMAIASVNFPDQTLVLPAILMYALVSSIIAAPYVKWAGGRGAASKGVTA